ncbi:Transposon Ty3-I Gag-Pol polyprotein [Exaiptasia diaphana]|nr:Transposon Ty3-I Gag-Pol polyprotein [Exaiptasia diaphana]
MCIVCDGSSVVLNYFDDVVVYGSTPEEHWSNLRDMLKTLRAYGIGLNKKKCVMGVSELMFLGHIISAHERGQQPGTGTGTGNIADGLSRLPTTVPLTNVNVNFVKRDNALLSIEEIQEAGEGDEKLHRIMTAMNEE